MSEAPGDGKETVFFWSTGDLRRTSEDVRKAPSRKVRAKETSPVPVDARRYPRLDLKLPILYRVVGEDASRVPAAVRPALLCQTRNISPIGLCLSLEEILPSGAILSLTVHLVEQREKFEAMARVVWSRPAGDSVHTLTGLQFVVVDGKRLKEALHARVEALVRLMEG